MTEDTRKVQLGTSFDASGAKEGFEQLKQGAREMAQAVSQAGQTASKGLDGVADGAKRAADGFNREEGRMRASIQRSTLDLQTLGKSLSQKFETKIDFKGLDPTKFAAELASLKEAEQLIARIQAGAAADSFVSGLGSQVAAMREQQQLAKLTADEALRYKAALLGAGAAAEPLIAEISQLRAVQEAAAKAARDEAAAQKEAQAAASRRTGFVDSVKSQADSIGKSRADLLELQAAQLGVTKDLAPYIAKIREADLAHKGLAASGKLSAFQTQQLGFQVHDFVVQVASGQSPLTAFVQQGSQLSGTFGGAKGALSAVLSLLTPFRIAMLAAAAGVGVLSLELVHVESRLRELNTLQTQLSATGRGSLFSSNDLDEYIRELSKAPGVTRETATAIVSEFSKVHQIGGALFKDLGKIVADWAKATGQSVPAAAKDLAKMVEEPLAGAKRLDEATGKLSSAQLAAIQNAVKFGDTLRAQKILLEATTQATAGAAKNGLTPLQTAVNELGNSWEKALRQMENTEGLRTINALLASTVDMVTYLVTHAPNIGNLGNVGLGFKAGPMPGGAGTLLAAANLGADAAQSLFGPPKANSVTKFEGRGATGSFDAPGGTSSAVGQTDAERKQTDDFIKKQQEIAKGHRSEAQELADLKLRREQFNKALSDSITLYGKDGATAKSATEKEGAKLVQDQLRSGIAGTDKDIKEQLKRMGADGQRVIDAQLAGQVQSAKDALAEERAEMQFQQRFLQNAYQAGQVSLVDFYEGKRKAITDGVAAEIAALEKERKDVNAHLAKTTDEGKQEQDRARLKAIDREEARLRSDVGRETKLANQEAAQSFLQLSDQVTEYRANLLQLIGDEAGAARLREQIAARQDAQLATKARASGLDIPDDMLRQAAEARQQNRVLDQARKAAGVVGQGLGLEEQRIADAQRRGTISELEALQQVGEARKRVVPQLEAIQQAEEAVARSRPEDYVLQIETAQARLNLEKLKGDLDPLAEKFRTLFSDATGNLFADLANNPKNSKEAIKRWAASITTQLNQDFGRDLANKLFSKDGLLGGLPGSFGDLFRKNAPAAQKPLVDTTGVVTSLQTMQAQGVEPLTASLRSLQDAANATAQALRNASGAQPTTGDFARQDRGQQPAAPTAGDFARLDRGQTASDGTVTTGDFSRMDRSQTADTGERQVFELFKEAKRSTDAFSSSTSEAAVTVLKLAGAADRGNEALAALPYIIRLIQAATSSGGGGGGSGAFSLLGSYGGSAQAAFSQTSVGASGFGTGLAYGNLDYAAFIHEGGLVGQVPDVRPVPADTFSDAPRFHSGGIPGLKQNEVPAVLMGGPKGTREEVLTADDPRHSDNISPKLKHLIDRMPRYHDGGVVGEKSYIVPGASTAVAAPPAQAGASPERMQAKGDTHIHVSVTPPAGSSRETAMQWGAAAGRQMQHALRRNG